MARGRSLAEFQKSFPDEESCAAFLFKRRWPDGFVCPGCGKRRGYRHDPRVVGAMAGHVVLPWSHRAFSLLKRWALGTYHGLPRKHVDTYLNEFVFRYNRRFYRHVSFEALFGLATHHEPTGYWDIIRRDNPRKSAGWPPRAAPTTYRRA